MTLKFCLPGNKKEDFFLAANPFLTEEGRFIFDGLSYKLSQ